VDFLFPRMPPFMVSVLNLAAAVLLFGLAAISVWQGWHVLDESLLFDSRASTPLQTPMWIPQGLWFIGLAVFAGVTGACAVHAVILFVRDRGRLNELYGPLSLEGPDRGRDAGHAARRGQAGMISITAVAIGFGGMIVLLFLGLHVATALFLTAVIAIQIYFGGSLLSVYGTQLWSAMEDYILLSIPLYILLGEILVRSGATDKMYGAIALWLGPSARRACCIPMSAPPRCSRRCPARRCRPPRPSRRSRCPRSAAASTTTGWCSARSRPARRSAISFRPASRSSSTPR
jgi:hypothetical protein